jgi:hypothetical protein
MPGLPLIIPNAVQVGIEMTASGRKVMNVLGFDNTLAESVPAILDAVKSAWEHADGPLARHWNGLRMVGYHGVDLGSVDGAVGYLGSGGVGGHSDYVSTMASCAIIKLSSGTRGRSKQGRVFHGPLTDDQTDHDGISVSSSAIGDLTVAYEAFRVALQVNLTPWVVISRAHLSMSAVASLACEGNMATQRRRMR